MRYFTKISRPDLSSNVVENQFWNSICLSFFLPVLLTTSFRKVISGSFYNYFHFNFQILSPRYFFWKCTTINLTDMDCYTLSEKNTNVDNVKTKFKITCLIFINAFNFKILRNLSTIWCLVVNWKPIIHFSWMVFSIGTEAKKSRKMWRGQ